MSFYTCFDWFKKLRLFSYVLNLKLYHAFSSFPLSTAVQYLMIPREEVELDDVTSYNIFDTKIYTILIDVANFNWRRKI
jgi:hypothetical protein